MTWSDDLSSCICRISYQLLSRASTRSARGVHSVPHTSQPGKNCRAVKPFVLGKWNNAESNAVQPPFEKTPSSFSVGPILFRPLCLVGEYFASGKSYFSNEDKEWLNFSKRCREWVSRSTEAHTSKNSSLRMLKGHFCSRFCKMFRLNFWMKTNRKRPPVAGKIIKKKRSSWSEISNMQELDTYYRVMFEILLPDIE